VFEFELVHRMEQSIGTKAIDIITKSFGKNF
jgi:hypothetical protein